ncbi:hypothetical protein [Candidatus Ichthyocystis sparus]|uniref:hypothetical protein n=1 Tax=Candidatus Ichthyocystis sparus TaxID=1561004 RepID=UPI000B88E4F8|nr:hypothetical protein [Candidatus Ichthyocystis sparus]
MIPDYKVGASSCGTGSSGEDTAPPTTTLSSSASEAAVVTEGAEGGVVTSSEDKKTGSKVPFVLSSKKDLEKLSEAELERRVKDLEDRISKLRSSKGKKDEKTNSPPKVKRSLSLEGIKTLSGRARLLPADVMPKSTESSNQERRRLHYQGLSGRARLLPAHATSRLRLLKRSDEIEPARGRGSRHLPMEDPSVDVSRLLSYVPTSDVSGSYEGPGIHSFKLLPSSARRDTGSSTSSSARRDTGSSTSSARRDTGSSTSSSGRRDTGSSTDSNKDGLLGEADPVDLSEVSSKPSDKAHRSSVRRRLLSKLASSRGSKSAKSQEAHASGSHGHHTHHKKDEPESHGEEETPHSLVAPRSTVLAASAIVTYKLRLIFEGRNSSKDFERLVESVSHIVEDILNAVYVELDAINQERMQHCNTIDWKSHNLDDNSLDHVVGIVSGILFTEGFRKQTISKINGIVRDFRDYHRRLMLDLVEKVLLSSDKSGSVMTDEEIGSFVGMSKEELAEFKKNKEKMSADSREKAKEEASSILEEIMLGIFGSNRFRLSFNLRMARDEYNSTKFIGNEEVTVTLVRNAVVKAVQINLEYGM